MQISQQPDGARAVYVISVAAELAGVHAQTLRIYERKGLVEPARTPGGSRRYSDIDISLLRRIQELTNEGLNLVGVKKVMDLEQRISRLETEITSLETSTEASLAEVHRQYRRDLVPLQQAPVPWLDPKRKQF
jgi:MerR family transcriptional regulator/heat shock protein HspR|tara:strand:- start:103 stop:501 length:399 start_codon:yes stop_codon:yes gene_type:complete